MVKRAYAYLRVSTFIQVEGKSLEGQLKEIEAYCNAFNIKLEAVYSDEGKVENLCKEDQSSEK